MDDEDPVGSCQMNLMENQHLTGGTDIALARAGTIIPEAWHNKAIQWKRFPHCCSKGEIGSGYYFHSAHMLNGTKKQPLYGQLNESGLLLTLTLYMKFQVRRI